MMCVDVEEIVKDWLRAHGYDGLANEECGCCLDDFAPCGEMGMSCRPAMKRTVTDADYGECAGCEFVMDAALPPGEPVRIEEAE